MVSHVFSILFSPNFYCTSIFLAVEVHASSTESGCSSYFKADAVIISVPLGVLKAGGISFQPSLPEWKQQAINNLGFGLLNKVNISGNFFLSSSSLSARAFMYVLDIAPPT